MTTHKRGRLAWAVAIRTKGGLSLATFDERLPLYWSRAMAKQKSAEWGGEVIRIQVEWDAEK